MRKYLFNATRLRMVLDTEGAKIKIKKDICPALRGRQRRTYKSTIQGNLNPELFTEHKLLLYIYVYMLYINVLY